MNLQQQITVGELIRKLSGYDWDIPVHFLANPQQQPANLILTLHIGSPSRLAIIADPIAPPMVTAKEKDA